MKMEIPLRYNDYDTKGHVNNAVYLTYFEMARERAWLECAGGDSDFPFVVAEARIRYVSEAMIGTPLTIQITTEEVRNRAWVWSYLITATADGRLIAEGSTVQVMFDYVIRKSVQIPDSVREALARV